MEVRRHSPARLVALGLVVVFLTGAVASGPVAALGATPAIAPWRALGDSGPRPEAGSLYNVSFNETGLPNGTSWSASINGTLQSSTTHEIYFLVPNGTYPFVITPLAGYTVSPSPPNYVAVTGAYVALWVNFTAITYPVGFNESGLPSATNWSLEFANHTHWSDGAAHIDLKVANGSDPYIVGLIPGYVAAPANGTVLVNGTPIVVAVVFSPVYYSVNVSETGLPVGTNWSATVGNATRQTNGTSLAFPSTNGTYSYSIAEVPGYSVAPASGTVLVNGTNVSLPVTYSLLPPDRYPITFVETGLAPATNWSVNVSNTVYSGNGSSITALKDNGSHAYSVLPVAGYATTQNRSGTVDVAGAARTVNVTFAPITYVASFRESGLPAGTNWSVTVGTGTPSSTSPYLNVTLANGTYSFAVSALPGYVASPSSGHVTLSGGPATVSIQFTTFNYTVTWQESGLPSGTNWSLTAGGSLLSSKTSEILSSLANGTYAYHLGEVANYTPSPNRGNVTISGAPVVETIVFALNRYAVTFNQTGLGFGLSWGVQVGVANASGTGTQLSVLAPNGTTTFAVQAPNGYVASPAGGQLGVAGQPVFEAVTFTRTAARNYSVWFNESGLPTSTPWSVTVNGTLLSGSTASLSLALVNGSYPFTVHSPSGYSAAPLSGTAVVAGAPVAEPIAFTRLAPGTFVVNFDESGLTVGTSWSVTFNGTLRAGSGSALSFVEPNGSYSFSVGPVAGYTAAPDQGALSVNGRAVNESISFTPVPPATFAVTFASTGLSNGTLWTVTINSAVLSGAGPNLTVDLVNGSYDFTVGAVTGYNVTPASGVVVVAGAPRLITLSYTPIPPAREIVTFEETGLPNGANWSVTFDGATLPGNGSSIVFTVPGGIYDFTANATGFSASPASGVLTVQGGPVTELIKFTSVSPAGSPTGGLGGSTLIFILAALVIVVVGALIAFATSRRSHEEPADEVWREGP